MVMKKNSSIIYSFSVLITLFAVVSLSGCFSDWSGNPANLVISFGSAGREVNYDANDSATHNLLDHKIELTSAEKKLEFSFTGNTTFNASVTPGNWNISIVSYLNDEVYAAGSKDVTIKSGQNKETDLNVSGVCGDILR